MTAENRRLGARIRSLRSDRGLSLPALAEAASVSTSMLSAVELGQKSPTITILARIAHGLGTSLSTLVADLDEQRLIVRRAKDQDAVDQPGGWRKIVVSPVVLGVNFEWIHVMLPPGCESPEFPAYASGSHEYVLVEAGLLRIEVGGAVVELKKGDSLYFAADAVHRYANPGARPCSHHVAALIMRARRAATPE